MLIPTETRQEKSRFGEMKFYIRITGVMILKMWFELRVKAIEKVVRLKQ